MKNAHEKRAAWLHALAALAAASLCGLAQAVVQTPDTINPEGDMLDIPYGQAGNVLQLQPMLFVQGLGSANDPSSVVALNPLLQFSFSVNGIGTGLMTIDYRVHNSSATESFNDFRFMLFTNPDGDQTLFKDTLSETWGAAAPGEPALREGRDFNAADTILSRFPVSNNLNEAPTPLDAACIAAAGCDATVGMQWNAPLVGPGQTFVVKAALSDDAQTLSARWIDVTAVNSADTALRLSGVVAVVPEPASALMLLAGLGLLGGLARRQVRR